MSEQRYIPGDKLILPTGRRAVCKGYRVESGRMLAWYVGGGEVEIFDSIPLLRRATAGEWGHEAPATALIGSKAAPAPAGVSGKRWTLPKPVAGRE